MRGISEDTKKVYSVGAFNRGVATWLQRLPSVWVEGEVTELRRQVAWQSVFLTLKDPADGACLPVTMPRGQFDALRLDLVDGERVHVFGRPELFEARGDFRLRALSIERFGLGDHLAALERLKTKLGAEGLFAADRKRRLPLVPRRIGIVTGNDAAAKRDLLTTITTRFPAARIVVAETYVQGPRAAGAVVEALRALCGVPELDVIVVARGGGSFEDLLPFSDERLVRAFAECAVPIVSAVGHEQDTPLCDLAADVRASTPTAAGKLVVPDSAGARRTACRLTREARTRRCGRCRAPARAGGSGSRTAAAGARIGRRAEARDAGARRRPAASALPARDARARLRDRPRGLGDRADAARRRSARRGRGRRRRLRSTRRMSAEPASFEDAQRELEQIVERLERGQAPLDEAVALWERGEELYRFCLGKLDAAQGKVEELAKLTDN